MSNFVDLKIQFDEQLQTEKEYNLGTEDWKLYKKKYQLKIAALNEFQDLYSKVGEKNFIKLAFSAITLNEGLCSPTELFIDGDQLEQKYYIQLREFNKRFLIDNITNVPINITLKFLTESLVEGNISKDFIDAMKLSPDAPIEYRNSLKSGKWDNDKEEEEGKKEKGNMEIKNKYWYDVEEMKESEEDQIKEADLLALNNKFEESIRIYKTFIRENTSSDLIYKMLLCIIASDDIILAKRELERTEEVDVFINTFEYRLIKELIPCIENIDYTSFNSCIHKYNEERNFEFTWTTTILLKIKNNMFFTQMQ